jgi:hypothetical protein
MSLIKLGIASNNSPLRKGLSDLLKKELQTKIPYHAEKSQTIARKMKFFESYVNAGNPAISKLERYKNTANFIKIHPKSVLTEKPTRSWYENVNATIPEQRDSILKKMKQFSIDFNKDKK